MSGADRPQWGNLDFEGVTRILHLPDATANDQPATLGQVLATGAATPGVYVMPTSQATAQFTPVGSFPVTIEVRDESGVLCDEFGVSKTLTGDVLLGFDVAIKATVRYL